MADPAFPFPAKEVVVPQYPTPYVPGFETRLGHIVAVELVSAEVGKYEPLPTDGSVIYTGRDADKWPDTLYLVAERPTPDGKQCVRYWANDRSQPSQDVWNYAITYALESTAHPIFLRSYIVPRGTGRTPISQGAALGSVIDIALTNGGSGYTSAPTVVVTGGAGTGVAFEVVITAGVVTAVRFTAFGSGYTSAPAISFTGGGGTGAAATAYIQPQTAILIKEEMQQLPEDSPLRSRYVRVIRVYETLPGPLLVGQDLDTKLGVSRPYTQQIVNAASYTPVAGDSVTPIDKWHSLVKKLTTASGTFTGFHLTFPAVEVITLPDKLVAVDILSESNSGTGTSFSTGVNWSWSKQSSSAEDGDLFYQIEQGVSALAEAETHIMLFPVGTALAAILAAVTASLWPIIKPEGYMIAISGDSISERESASQNQIGTASTSGSTEQQVGSTVKTQGIPPTIHPLFFLSGASPSSLPATSPAVFPTGRYIPPRASGLSCEPYSEGWMIVVATVVIVTASHV